MPGYASKERDGSIHGDVNFVPFEKYLRREVGILQISGLYSLNSVFTDNIVRWNNWERLSFFIGIMQGIFIIPCEFRTFIDVWQDNPNFAIDSFTSVCLGILCIVKAWKLWSGRNELRKLLRLMAVKWNESRIDSRIREENMKIAKDTCQFCKLYITVVAILTICYSLRPYTLSLSHFFHGKDTNVSYNNAKTIMPATYPDFLRTETLSKYIILLTWEQFVIFCAALYWLSSDLIFAQLVAHVAIQFRVLCHDLTNVTDNDSDDVSRNELKFIDRLAEIVKRHCDLYKHCKTINGLFNPIIFLTMLLSGAIMCFCVFQVQKEILHGNWNEVSKYIFQAITSIIQVMVYCAFAEKLNQQSRLMTQAAYDCQWTEQSPEFKIILRIIMMRSQRGFNCTAYGFFAVNLKQITVIGQGAASYFALLKSLT